MAVGAITDNYDLWAHVAELHESLRAAGSDADADRLHNAMTISGHPGQVWPQTLAVLRNLLREQPLGLDERTASACADYLARWR